MIDDIVVPRPKKRKTQKAASHPRPKPTPPALDSNMPLPEITINLAEAPSRQPKARGKQNIHKLLARWKSLDTRGRIIIIVGAALAVGAIGLAIYFLFIEKAPAPANAPVIQALSVPKSNTVASPLSGLQIDPSLAKRPVTAIMIENSVYARPQSGLLDAGVVYEAIAEGGITRFMAVFQDTRPQYIGPVRSLRPYYLDFALPYSASIAHVGGSPEALSRVRSGPRDLDQFFNAGSYWRQASREAPHNVYTSFDKLDALNNAKGYTESSYIGWPRKKDAASKNPAAKSIDLNISSGDFNVHYDWDATSNSYVRFEGGKPHMVTASADDKNPQQLHPKVVIAPIMSYNIESDGQHSEYGDTGAGTVYIFQDGGVTQGTWSKTDENSPLVFKDSTGKEIALDAGQTWVTLLSDESKVHYTP